jgi:alpha-L-arabinofuranosidase
MGTVMSFHEKYRHKQLDFEKKALRDLTVSDIDKRIEEHFAFFLHPYAPYRQTIFDMCQDYAIEAYLLGSSYGRFGYYGEPAEVAYMRSEARMKNLVNDLFDFWLFWFDADDLPSESLSKACEAYMVYWWKEGFEHTVRRYRLRMH